MTTPYSVGSMAGAGSSNLLCKIVDRLTAKGVTDTILHRLSRRAGSTMAVCSCTRQANKPVIQSAGIRSVESELWGQQSTFRIAQTGCSMVEMSSQRCV
jgi:hypothetical protein